ncbi:MAG: hypothetical protein U1A23_01585 [Candidatus Sungbacteria bacterium]|nr:hypothetical protein [bacterium]MDZ4285598.1 hypothetical protein [Candidatus Sungbacteria bacterium]
MRDTDGWDSIFFDTLCRACIEVAEPIVRQALMRENEEFSREFPGQDFLFDDQEIKDHTHDASRMMMGAWIDILRDTFYRMRMTETFLVLSDDLLPPEQNVRPEFWQVFQMLASTLSLTNNQMSDIRRTLGDYLFMYYKSDSIPLPFRLCIVRAGDILSLVHVPIEPAYTFRP